MSKIENTIKAIRDVLLYVLLFLTAISYHPTIIHQSRIAGYDSGTILSRYIVLLFAVVFVLSFGVSIIRKSHLVRVFLAWLAIIIVFSLFVQAFFGNHDMTRELRPLAIVLGSVMIGYDLELEKSKFVFMILVFCLTALFSGVMQVFVNNGGFVIASQYLTDAKNSLGAMLSTSCFLLLYLFQINTRRLSKILLLALVLITFAVLVTIRARMATVALILVAMYYYYLKTRNRSIIITIIVSFVVLFVGLLLMPSSILNYLEASFTAGTQSEDFTSGRMLTYLDAISYLLESPLLGNVLHLNRIGWIHNYPLLKLYQFGLLFSWPIIALYVYIGVHAIRLSRRTHPTSIPCMGGACLLIPYLISMAEPTFPFGPGTVTLINFLLLGVAERVCHSNHRKTQEREEMQVVPHR